MSCPQCEKSGETSSPFPLVAINNLSQTFAYWWIEVRDGNALPQKRQGAAGSAH